MIESEGVEKVKCSDSQSFVRNPDIHFGVAVGFDNEERKLVHRTEVGACRLGLPC